jgi:hypothetical protein
MAKTISVLDGEGKLMRAGFGIDCYFAPTAICDGQSGRLTAVLCRLTPQPPLSLQGITGNRSGSIACTQRKSKNKKNRQKIFTKQFNSCFMMDFVKKKNPTFRVGFYVLGYTSICHTLPP